MAATVATGSVTRPKRLAVRTLIFTIMRGRPDSKGRPVGVLSTVRPWVVMAEASFGSRPQILWI